MTTYFGWTVDGKGNIWPFRVSEEYVTNPRKNSPHHYNRSTLITLDERQQLMSLEKLDEEFKDHVLRPKVGDTTDG